MKNNNNKKTDNDYRVNKVKANVDKQKELINSPEAG
jgi:hypothetical protein